MSTYRRAPFGFKTQLAQRRDEIVLEELAARLLLHAREHLHSRPYTLGTLQAICLLYKLGEGLL